MAEKSYPMTAEGKEKLQAELSVQKLLNVLRLRVHSVTYQKTQSMMQQKMNKVL